MSDLKKKLLHDLKINKIKYTWIKKWYDNHSPKWWHIITGQPRCPFENLTTQEFEKKYLQNSGESTNEYSNTAK